MAELEDLMPLLDPPQGGLQRLQRHVENRGHALRARWRWVIYAPALALMVLAIALLLPAQLKHQRQTAALLQVMQTDLPPDTVRVEHGTVLELPSGRSDVRFYLIAQTPSPRSEHPPH